MLSCIADSSPLRLAHGVQSLLVSTTRAVLMCMRAPNRDESSHSSARTWAMSFHTSPRCNNGIHIHIHSERFALYYILFSNDVFRLNGGISRFETFHVMEDQSTCVELPICRGMSVLQDLNASSIAWSSVQSCWISCSVLPRLPMAMRMVYMPFSLVCERKKRPPAFRQCIRPLFKASSLSSSFVPFGWARKHTTLKGVGARRSKSGEALGQA